MKEELNTKVKIRIKKGDKVKIIAGKDRGKIGKVLKIIPVKSRLVVEGAGLVKKHFRRRSEKEQGGIREVPLPINISNVALFCSNCNKGVRAGMKIEGKSKIRICRKCQQAI